LEARVPAYGGHSLGRNLASNSCRCRRREDVPQKPGRARRSRTRSTSNVLRRDGVSRLVGSFGRSRRLRTRTGQ
jgi:hypothetical protein